MHGSSPSVGVIGYLLGGGLSFYGRRHGLAVNHVRGVRGGHARRSARGSTPTTTATCSTRCAAAAAATRSSPPWAGASARTRRSPAGAMFFAADDIRRLLRTWRDCQDAPDTITTTFRLLRLPPLPEVPEPLRAAADGMYRRRRPAGCGRDAPRAAACAARPSRSWAGFGNLPSAAVARLHGDPEDPVPVIGDGILLREARRLASECSVGAAEDGPLLAAELRHLGGALADGAGRGRGPRSSRGPFLLFGVGDPRRACAGGRAAATSPLPRRADAVGDGTRFMSFAERADSLETRVPTRCGRGWRRIRAAGDRKACCWPRPPAGRHLPAAASSPRLAAPPRPRAGALASCSRRDVSWPSVSARRQRSPSRSVPWRARAGPRSGQPSHRLAGGVEAVWARSSARIRSPARRPIGRLDPRPSARSASAELPGLLGLAEGARAGLAVVRDGARPDGCGRAGRLEALGDGDRLTARPSAIANSTRLASQKRAPSGRGSEACTRCRVSDTS